MVQDEKWGEVVAYAKLVLVWAANYFTFTNLNAWLSTLVLLMTMVYTGLQIDKLLREREAALRKAREESLKKVLRESGLGDLE